MLLVVAGRGLAEDEAGHGPFTTRLPTTYVFVTDRWEVESELFYDGAVGRRGGPTQLFQSEIEIGLPGRVQIGFNEGLVHDPGDRLRHQEVVFETRFALAPWGKIPLNPTLFAEWHSRNKDSDGYELKLLLAQEIGSRWFWAFNATFEHDVGGELASESDVSQSLLYTLIPSKLRVGVEITLNRPIERNGHGKPEVELGIGPSVAWQPFKHAELKLAPLIGATSHAPHVEIAVLVGIDF